MSVCQVFRISELPLKYQVNPGYSYTMQIPQPIAQPFEGCVQTVKTVVWMCFAICQPPIKIGG